MGDGTTVQRETQSVRSLEDLLVLRVSRAFALVRWAVASFIGVACRGTGSLVRGCADESLPAFSP